MEKDYFKKKRIYHFMLVILMIVIFSPLCMECSSKDQKPKINNAELKDFEIPMYGYAENVEPYTLEDGLIRGVAYTVKIPYPPPDVLDFYDEAMRKIGYEPFVEEYLKYADRKWQTFVDSTKKGQPYIAQLTASWADPKSKVRTVLNLRYYWYVDHSKSKIILGENFDLNITFQVMPFFDVPRGDEFEREQGAK